MNLRLCAYPPAVVRNPIKLILHANIAIWATSVVFIVSSHAFPQNLMMSRIVLKAIGTAYTPVNKETSRLVSGAYGLILWLN